MIKSIYKKIKRNYFELDEDLVIRQKILELVHSRFLELLWTKDAEAKGMQPLETNHKYIHIPDISKELGIPKEIITNQCSVLLVNKEIEYSQDKNVRGFHMCENGFSAIHDKKYIRQAEDLLWKKRERIFNFVQKPILLIVSVITCLIAIVSFYNNLATQKELQQMGLKLKQQEAKIFQLDNNTRNSPH